MWLFIVTFTTVEYGDIIPSSYCARSKWNVFLLIKEKKGIDFNLAIAALIALMGLLSSALCITYLHKN